MSLEENHDLTKKSLEELKEMSSRYEALLKNRKVLENLVDKGESIKKAHLRVHKELQFREHFHGLEHSLNTVSVTCKENLCDLLNEKHVQHICDLDKPFEDTRYRPHRTLVPGIVLTKRNELIKRIPLAESLVIQIEQYQKAKEDQAKQLLLGFTKEDEVIEPEIDLDPVIINSDGPEKEIEILSEHN